MVLGSIASGLGGAIGLKAAGGLWDDLTGKSQQDEANKKNLAQLQKTLDEIGWSESGQTAFDLTGDLYGSARNALRSGSSKAQATLAQRFAQGRQANKVSFKETVAALREGFGQAQQAIGSTIGSIVEQQIAMQRQSMAQLAQQSVSTGLPAGAVAAMARGMQADAVRSSAGAMANIAQQQGQLAMQQGAALGQANQTFGAQQMQSFSAEGSQLAQMQQQAGQQLALMYQQQAGAFQDLAAMRAQARGQVQFKAGPSPLESIGQVVGGVASVGGFG